MDPGLLSIGKMAQMNNLTVATLRLYDRLGLLHPRYTDEATGYRYYDIRQNARLDMIAYMKELGMSLAEIGDILAREDITLIEDVLLRKHEQIHRQIRDLKIQHDMVERAIAGNPRLASPIAQPADRAAFFAAYALEDFESVRRKFLRVPPLPVRAAGKLLSPEGKAKLRKKLK